MRIASSVPKILRGTRKLQNESPKWPSNVTQGHREWHVYDFLLAFHSKYGPISHGFWDTMRYWLKIVNFWYPTSIWRTCCGRPRRNFTVGSRVGKLEWRGPPDQAMKKFDGKFSRFDTIHQRNRQTDGHRTTAKTAMHRRAVKTMIYSSVRY